MLLVEWYYCVYRLGLLLDKSLSKWNRPIEWMVQKYAFPELILPMSGQNLPLFVSLSLSFYACDSLHYLTSVYTLIPDAYLQHDPISCLPSLQVHISHVTQRWAYHPSVCICPSRMKLAAVGSHFTYQRVSQISINSIIRLEKKSIPAFT